MLSDEIMKNDTIYRVWLAVLIVFLLSLTVWAIFYIEKPEHQITIFGIVGAIVTALTSVLSVNLNHNKVKEREIDLLVIKEKQKVFEHFYNAYFEIIKSTKKGNQQKIQSKVENELMEFKRGLMNWGSEEIIQSYLNFEENIGKPDQSTSEMLSNGNKFIKDLRKEMGFHDSRSLNILNIILTAEAREELKNN
jgi:uncharacterized membrane protein